MQITEVNAIVAAIRNVDQEGLSQIIEAVKDQQSYLAKTNAREFRAGDVVGFDRGPRRGGWIEGTVLKVNRKTISVRANDGRMWRVSPNILEKV